MAICKCCGQEIKPTLSMDEYEARATPRLHQIDVLADRIDFSAYGWDLTPDGQRYNRLMEQQGKDEVAAGL